MNSRISAWGTAEAATFRTSSAAAPCAAEAMMNAKAMRRLSMAFLRFWGIGVSTVAQARHQAVAGELNQLHEQDEDGDGDHHHRGIETLIAVAHREVAEPPAADDAGHGRVADQGNRRHGDRRAQSREGLR